jgi:hypothetical protein
VSAAAPGLHPGDLVCRFQRRLGQVGERGGGPREFFQRVGRGEIEGSDAQKSSPVKHPEGVLWAKPVGRILDLADDASDPLLDRAGFRVGDAAPVLGVADQMIPKGDGGPEDGEQSLPTDAGTTQLRDERRHIPVQRGRLGFPVGGGAQSLHQAHEAEQRQVGIGHLGQRLDRSVGEGVVQWIDQTGEGGIAEQSSRPIRLREPQTGEHGLGAAGAGRGHPLSLNAPPRSRGRVSPRSRGRIEATGQPARSAGSASRGSASGPITCGGRSLCVRRRLLRPRTLPAAPVVCRVRGAGGGAPARRRSPGGGSPPTPAACCAGRSRRRVRPASRPRVRCAPSP